MLSILSADLRVVMLGSTSGVHLGSGGDIGDLVDPEHHLGVCSGM